MRWIIQVNHPLEGWITVGTPFPTKACARSWVRFVRAFWLGCDVKVVQFAAKGGA